MVISQISKVDLTDIENILINKTTGLLNLVSYNVLNKFDQNTISYFCYKHAIYQLPTIELIDFLKNEIGTFKSIEIGCGNGSIGRNLNIPITDNKLQERPDIRLYYIAINQPVISYPIDVEKIDAIDAIIKYKPEIVIGSWITDINNTGNTDAIDESKIINSNIKKYIHIGNETTHSNKKILNGKHKKIKFDWLLSRSLYKDNNIIYIFEN